MKILLTGASGFIGSKLLKSLIKKYGVGSIVVLSSKNIKHVECFVYKSPQDFNINEKYFKKITHIIHAGAFTPKETSQVNNIEDSCSNIDFTKNLLRYKFESLKRIINLSTIDVYAASQVKLSEKSQINPSSLYGMSKLYCERMIKCFSENHKVDYINLRIGHVYGPGEEEYKKVIPLTIKKILENKPIQIWGNGTELRSFIFVEDVVNSIINSISSSMNNKNINVASGNAISILELINMLTSFNNRSNEIQKIQTNHASRDMIFDNSLLLNNILEKENDLKQGLKIEYEYMKKKYENNI
ncbi:NAD-dependent epimerase/dehydratase family protein [Gammaproteobacteria bacterium]|nr:NAD-dependent epimerase/dehydratase family protein [Gammaproteobacteria bacterium]